MLFDILFVDLKDNFSVFVHFLMALGNDKSILSLATKYQELNSLFLSTLGLTVIRNH